MSRRRRVGLVVLTTFALLAAAEVGLNLLKGPEACVEIENGGPEPIEDLVLVLGDKRTTPERIGPGERTRIFLSGEGDRTLQVFFKQRGNALSTYQSPGFDPSMMYREGNRLVLKIQTNQVDRYQDEAVPATPFGRWIAATWKRFWKSLEDEA